MTQLSDLVNFCNERSQISRVKDFPGAYNGLQFENSGQVTKIGAAVDSGLIPFQKSIAAGIDFLIVHHGMHWNGVRPAVGVEYQKIKALIEGNLAVYSCHLPLDAHPEIGNSAILATKLGIEACGTFAPYEGVDIGFVGSWQKSRIQLNDALTELFGAKYSRIEFGSDTPEKICVVTGSGASVVDLVKSTGADTLITGELRQQHFNQAQELGLNLYCCGHYATETFGVEALAKEAAAKFNLDFEFISTDCPL
ncbi:Nif3-like dinuclear metal center hexameric protein [Puniceicoccaceae bacterium K14]|nr:Nif3-like dinuclear metal center hexameric protein [Puniceicoccaceae bacterium K14]